MGMPAPPPALPPDATQADRIRAWHQAIVSGDSVPLELGTYNASLGVAVVRYVNGLGPDRTDPHGVQAMADVLRALETDG